ncbi:MAG: LysR family transcriptional regulator [Gammaproteobacteria bacterium]|nr:LysR family transcriptional regulator [Gammaproteobacteria bacterium]
MSYPLTFRQLEIFASVAKHLSFTQASEELHLSQPAVSMQVKQMEHLTGFLLTEKIGKQLFLTEAGKIILNYAEHTLAAREVLEETLTALEGKEKGHLALAVPETANQFVTLLLARFRSLHPGISFHLQVHNRKGLLNCIKSNTTDLVIMGTTPVEMELLTESFMNNPLVVIASPNHPLCKRKVVKLDDLVENEFVVREEGSGTRNAMKRFFNEHQVQLKMSMEMPNNEAVKQAVAAGLGLGIVSLHTLQQELALKQVKVLNVIKFPIMRIWYMVHHKQKVLSPAMILFSEFVIDKTQEIWIKKYPELQEHL